MKVKVTEIIPWADCNQIQSWLYECIVNDFSGPNINMIRTILFVSLIILIILFWYFGFSKNKLILKILFFIVLWIFLLIFVFWNIIWPWLFN